MNIGLAVTRSALRYPARPAVFDEQRVLDYRALDQRSSRVANYLLGRFGIGRGDKVVLLTENRVEVLEVLYGVAKAGGVYVGLNFRLTEAEYEDILENAGPRLLVVSAQFEELGASLAAKLGIEVVSLDAEGAGGHEALLAAAAPTPPPTLHEVRPEDDFCLVYTSGTTGRPKGVLFDHRAVLQHATVCLLEYELSPSSRWLTALPHNSSVQITMVPLILAGGSIGMLESRGFDGVRFADSVERHGITHSYLVPTMLFRLLDQVPSADPLASIETIGYGAAPMPPERIRELLERYGCRFNQLYGMVEISSIGTMLRKQDHAEALATDLGRLASCGQSSYAIDVRVVDEAGVDVPVGERGEVIFGGPYLMKGYHRDPDRTAEALRDGWMHSGDVGQFDEQGFLFIVDRIKDMIICGGHNVLPTEIENVLYEHDGVLEASVVGLPDKEWGESILAVIARRGDRDIDADELMRFCKERGLPTIMMPRRIEFVDSLPKNAVGKIAKRDLREAFAPPAG